MKEILGVSIRNLKQLRFQDNFENGTLFENGFELSDQEDKFLIRNWDEIAYRMGINSKNENERKEAEKRLREKIQKAKSHISAIANFSQYYDGNEAIEVAK